MIRIVIADDHDLIRTGVKALLAHESDFVVVGEAKDGHEALDILTKKVADVILLDISMPDKGGFAVIEELKKRRIRTPIIILTMHPEQRYAARAYRASVAGYLTKGCASAELVTAIRTVVSGKRYVSQEYAKQLTHNFQSNQDRLPHEELSDREFQIFCLIAGGATIREIAKELTISEATVYTHRERIMEKMNMRSVADLTRYAVEQGLLE